MTLPLLPTTVVGSYPQPNWLVDKEAMRGKHPPRVRMREIWRVSEPHLAEAQDDATLLAIRALEEAGVDIITDGEMRRESYSNRVATALDGIDVDNPGTALDRTGAPVPVPRVVGPIRRHEPVQVRDTEFLRGHTRRTIKMTLPGPFTMTQLSQNDYYPDVQSMAMAYADAVNAEIKDLFAAGADIVQLDEPYLQARSEAAQEYALEVINRALAGVEGTTALHMCFGYAYIVKDKPSGYSFLTQLKHVNVQQISIEAAQPDLDPAVLAELPDKTIVYGVLDLNNPVVETPETVAERIRRALAHVPAERLVIAPDCGMKYLDRAVAFAKLKAMVAGTELVRRELSQ